jgi:hypothetical protein
MACTAAVSFFQNPALDRESNMHRTFWPSKTVKRVGIIFENIRYVLYMEYIHTFIQYTYIQLYTIYLFISHTIKVQETHVHSVWCDVF